MTSRPTSKPLLAGLRCALRPARPVDSRQLLRERRLRRRAAPLAEAAALLPQMVCHLVDGRHLGRDPGRGHLSPAVTYQLAAMWGATSTVANHVTNITFHAANALLILAIARTVVGVGLAAATFAALAFATLPLHAESVIWITGRVDTIPTFSPSARSWPTQAGAAAAGHRRDYTSARSGCFSARSSASRTPSSWWRRSFC